MNLGKTDKRKGSLIDFSVKQPTNSQISAYSSKNIPTLKNIKRKQIESLKKSQKSQSKSPNARDSVLAGSVNITRLSTQNHKINEDVTQDTSMVLESQSHMNPIQTADDGDSPRNVAKFMLINTRLQNKINLQNETGQILKLDSDIIICKTLFISQSLTSI